LKVSKMEVTLLDYSGDDLSVVNAARVSFNKQSEFEYEYGMDGLTGHRLNEKDRKLINYLAKYKHKSPFNHAFMSFRVKAPIFVARQLVKHEYLPWNEVSRRYVTDEPEFYFPDYWRKAADNVKQGSSEEAVIDNDRIEDEARDAVYEAWACYWQFVNKKGVCAEQARMVLPQNTMTEWIWSGTLFAFAKMCKLRLDSHTQKETREVAQLVAKEAEVLFPVSWLALMEYGE
jgi:thymidylate synthase (FAD)